jgi:hypothetical protein
MRFKTQLRQTIKRCLSDRQVRRLQFREVFGRWPDLRQPKTFQEKLQWLNLYGDQRLRSTVADKLACRQYVADRVGGQYLPPLLWWGTSAEAIPFDELPRSFVLKASHGSQMTRVVADQHDENHAALRAEARQWLKEDFYLHMRERCYKNLPRRLMVEAVLGGNATDVPYDYKFFVFNGRLGLIQLDLDRFVEHRRNLYDPDWNPLPVSYAHPPSDERCPPPRNLQKMRQIAETLGQDFSFIRVDLYEVDGVIYFGELTNYPEAGLGRFDPPEYDWTLGQQLDLSARPDAPR